MTGWRPPLRESTAAPELSGDLTNEDLQFELRQLHFERNEFRRVLLDRDARDYIVASLSTRQPRRA